MSAQGARARREPLSAVRMRSPWLLVGAVLLSFFWQLWAVPLFDLDEGAFAEATREMLASGDLITPHRDGQPRYDKPILIYWLQASSVWLLGFNELALRLPSALAATFWVIALWGFTRRFLDAESAIVAGLIMVLSLQVSLIAKAATADALLNLFIALTFFEIYRYANAPGTAGSGRFVLRAYLWMALGFLTKGPVAILFPAVVSLLYFWSMGGARHWLHALLSPWGWLVFAIIVLPWHLAIYLRDGSGFFESFYLVHNSGRFLSTMHGHTGFLGYYLVVTPLILLPFSGWFLRLLPEMRTAWSDPLERFLWIWFTVVLVFFSFSATKLPHYMLYGATPLFILMARHRDQLRSRWLAFVPAIVLMGCLVTLPGILSLAATFAHRDHEIAMLEHARTVFDPVFVGAMILGLVATLAVTFWSRPPYWRGLIMVGLIQTLILFGPLLPRVAEIMQGPVKEAALFARQLNLPTVAYRTSLPSFSVYRDAITPSRPPIQGDLIFLRVDKLARLSEDYPDQALQLLYMQGPVALVLMGARQGGTTSYDTPAAEPPARELDQ